MLNKINHHKIYPVKYSGILNFRFRKIFQNPKKILDSYIKEGASVLDLGCGPGFFTIEIAKLTGESGKVIAADLQESMLKIIKQRIQETVLKKRIKTHLCQGNKIGITDKVDFILVFYMFHEIQNQNSYLNELKSILKPKGKILLIEPKFHVSKKTFQTMLNMIEINGFKILESPKVFFSRSILLTIKESEK